MAKNYSLKVSESELNTIVNAILLYNRVCHTVYRSHLMEQDEEGDPLDVCNMVSIMRKIDILNEWPGATTCEKRFTLMCM